MTHCEHFLVKGRVQGVFFRAATQEYATRLGLTGWVRNLPDGQVELVACGKDQSLASLHEWLWQGPRHAAVEAVERQPDSATGFEAFTVRY